VAETVENVADDFSLTLVRGKNFDCPVGGEGESVGYFAVFIAGNAFPGKNCKIGYCLSTPKGTAQFWIGAGDALGFDYPVDVSSQIALNCAVFSLGHRFLAGGVTTSLKPRGGED
jgi:hypothetical protein